MNRIMMKTGLIIGMIALTLSCNNGLNDSSGMSSKGKNNRVDRSQRTTLDGAKYVDFTVKKNDAAKITKQDVLYELNGTYKIAGGNSYITINRMEGTITLSSDDAFFEGRGGRNMYAKYSFEVKAADSNCLYFRMGNKKKGQLIVDEKLFNGPEVPDLAVCVPLYGYSRNRIEVSPVMNGYSALPSGTYWAQKK